MPRRSSEQIVRLTRPSASSRATTRERALWLRWTASARSCIRCWSWSGETSRSSTSYSLTPSECSSWSARSSALVALAWRLARSRHADTSEDSGAVIAGRIIPGAGKICVHILCINNRCIYMYSHAMTSRSTSSSSTTAPRWDARLWGALIVLCGILFLDGLDVSMVGVALPSIKADLHLSPSQLQWVVSGYVLGYGGLLLLGGRAADLLGRRRVLLIALSVFVVAS